MNIIMFMKVAYWYAVQVSDTRVLPKTPMPVPKKFFAI